MWGVVKARGLFVTGPLEAVRAVDTRRRGLKERALALLRRAVFDRFGRS